jgi:8-oxo-dGTP diphosphatase
MVNHRGLGPENFWAPPGGGIELGQSAAETLKREFLEETGINIRPEGFTFACEYIQAPIHSIELFFVTTYESGELTIGSDPEMKKQIIQDVRWMEPHEIMALPTQEVHGIFRICQSPEDLMKLSGYWSI